MTDAIRTQVIAALFDVAPELEGQPIADDADLVDTFDLDSMDILHFVAAIASRIGIDVPEVDYDQVRTIGRAVAYLAGQPVDEEAAG